MPVSTVMSYTKPAGTLIVTIANLACYYRNNTLSLSVTDPGFIKTLVCIYTVHYILVPFEC